MEKTTLGLCVLVFVLTFDLLQAQLRLIDGPTPNEGRLEVLINGRWGTVCDDHWDVSDAQVACRQLGYPDAVEATRGASYGPGTGPIHLDDVMCLGMEHNLTRCKHAKVHDCDHREDAGVVCAPAVRLVNGLRPHEGRVEVFLGGGWGTICDNEWDKQEADVICRELGFVAAKEVLPQAGSDRQEVSQIRLKCREDERSVFDCGHSEVDSGIDCGDAGVRCLAPAGLRLVGGKTYREGRLEVLINGGWGTICDDDWDIDDARVACRQLGFPDAIAATNGGSFGQGNGAIHLDDVRCEGNEHNLTRCQHGGIGVHNCNHAEDAGIKCASNALKADLILYGGNIITMEEEGTGVEAIAISGDTILAVGTMDDAFRYAGSQTQVIFLNQQTLMPGFIDPHQHIILTAVVKGQSVMIGGDIYRSYDEVKTKMLETINQLTEDPANKRWAMFFGWDPELIPDLPTLSADFLDETFSSTLPVAVIGQSGHVAWVNHQSLEALNYTKNTPDPVGGKIVRHSEGNPTGQLLEGIMAVISAASAQQDPLSIVKSLREQFRIFASAGLTTVTEMVYQPRPDQNALMKQLGSAESFPLRIALYRLMKALEDDDPALETDLPEGIGNFSSRLWEAGIKLVADGSPHSGTMAIREPYLNTPLTENLGFPKAPNYGHLNYGNKALSDTIRRFHVQGKQMSVHAHGERAVSQVLNAYEKVQSKYPGFDNRHRMEHLGLMTVDQIARAGKLNLAPSFFVDHLRFYALTYINDIFGDRVNRWTPLSAATKSNVTWTIHQDHPTFPGNLNPFSNMKTAITRCHRDDPTTPYGPEYRVSIHEALKSYTVNAAWQLHLEQKVGSIKVGKNADLVVLSENPYNVDPFDLERIEVIETFVDGRRNNFAELKIIPGSEIKVLNKRSV